MTDLGGRRQATGVQRQPPSSGRLILATFVLASFLSASLLFVVEPLATKVLLPLLGGTPSVWNTAMVFFQAALLTGYGIGHLTLSRFGPRRHTLLQLVLATLPCLLLPIGLPDGWAPPRSSSPIVWTLLSLAVMVGAPFLVLSTASPTLQRWFSATDHPHAADPYFLYAAGNTGSLVALLAYPLVIEPALGLDTQARLWSVGYVAFVVLSAFCALLLRRSRRGLKATVRYGTSPTEHETSRRSAQAPDLPHGSSGGRPHPSPEIRLPTRLRWIALAAIPSALMLGVTHHIATDIASMPLLWVLPLSLYLVTFIVAFGNRSGRPMLLAARGLRLLAVPLALSFLGLISSIWFELPLHLGVFVCAAMVAHGRLAAERPTADHLTVFYLLLSVGGVVGGILTALVAPLIFPTVLEYPLAIVASLAVLPKSVSVPREYPTHARLETPSGGTSANGSASGQARSCSPELTGRARTAVLLASVAVLAMTSVMIRSAGTQRALTLSIIVASIAIGGAYVLARTPTGYAGAVAVVLGVAILVPANPTRYSERTFFGVHRVYEDQAAGGRHVLTNGRTVHGMENFTGPSAGEPQTYYHPTGPIGQWFESNSARDKPWSVGVIGLGSGALAWYGRPGDTFTYYEIDPAVTRIAKNPELFTFIPNSKAAVDIVIGDGRLALADATDTRHDLLVVDAFSSDAIPLHLMTREALQLYVDRLTDNGVIAFHISNRYFDFEPVLARLADDLAIYGLVQSDVATPEQAAEGKLDATWVLLARSPDHLSPVATSDKWRELEGAAGAPLWTDQYSDLLHVFRWGG